MEVKKSEGSCACKGKNLEKFIQPVIFSILTNGSMNGYQLVKQIGEYATFSTTPDPAGVYRYLKVMASKGYIIQDGNGEYSMTAEGQDCFASWKETIRDYVGKLELLIEQL